MNVKDNLDKRTDELARIVWDYHLLHHTLEKADCILGLGTHDPNVAEYASDLYLDGWAPYLVFSGGVVHDRDVLKNETPKTEAEAFLNIAINKGVPKDVILLEKKAKNTGENFLFTAELLKSLDLDFNKFIIVQKPYMERRTYATGMVHWKNKKLILASQNISYDDYVKKSGISKDRIINTMIGDLQRIKIYPSKGFQIYQEIPNKVWLAYEELVKIGYDRRLIKS